MKINNIKHTCVAVLIAVSLLACGSDDKAVVAPQERPIAKLSGSSMLTNADVGIYEFTGVKGDEIATGTSDQDGNFTVSLQTSDKPIVVCLNNGRYIEFASGQSVPSADGEELCAVTNFVSGVEINLSINYFSHLAYAKAISLVNEGELPAGAVNQSNQRISKLLGMNVNQIHWLDVTSESSKTPFVTDRHLLSLAISAVSNLTANLDPNSTDPVHSNINTLSYSQIAFKDLSSDGVLDGIGVNSQQLSIGNVAVSVDLFRNKLAGAMFDSVNSTYNKTGLTGPAIKSMADLLNSSNDNIFGGVNVIPFDGLPTITTQLDTTLTSTGVAVYTFDISDDYSISNVSITFDGKPVAFTENNGTYTVTYDTTLFADDGTYPLVVTATNIYGVKTILTNEIIVFNTPSSTVGGAVYDGLIFDGNGKIYNFEGGVKGAELASFVTDSEGLYSIDILAHRTPILIEVTGGRYVEEASGKTVALQSSSNHILRAVAIHEPGVTINISVTTWTNIAAGLAEYKISRGLDTSTAIVSANFEINNILEINTLTTIPTDITKVNNAGPISDQMKAGFYAAGASQFTYDLSVAAKEQPAQDTINSINFSLLSYDDIKYDGILNGVGFNGNLEFGGASVDANTYRHGTGLGIIGMANNARNLSGLTSIDLLSTAKLINNSTSSIFGSTPIIPLDENGPMVSQFLPIDSIYNKGTFVVSFKVTDLVGLTQVELLINGQSYGFATDLYNPSFTINSYLMDDCRCEFTVRATSLAGSISDTTNFVQIDNRRFAYFYYYPNTVGLYDAYPLSITPENGRIQSYDATAGSSLFMGNTSLIPLVMHPSNKFGYFFDNTTFEFSKYDMDVNNGAVSNKVVLEQGPDYDYVGRDYHFSKDQRFLFKLKDNRVRQDGVNFGVSNVRPSSYIASYSVANDGSLTYLSQIDVGHGPIMMADNPVLDVVYVPLWESDMIGSYQVQANGSLIPLPGAPVITGNSPRYIVVDAKGTHAYIAFGLENVIKQYRFSPEGWLIFETSYPVGVTPRTIQIHSNGKVMYVANYDGTLNIFTINQTNGQLASAGSPDVISASGLRGMYLDPASENAVFWGTFGAIMAPINASNGSIGTLNSLFSANGWPVLPPMLTRGTANAIY